MKNYTRCCSCGARMSRKYKTCEKCYDNYKKGVCYIECNLCGYPFKIVSKYGLCYLCYKKILAENENF